MKFVNLIVLGLALSAIGIHGVIAQDADPASPNAQMQVVLDALAKLEPKPIPSLPPSLARLQPSAADAAIQVIQDKGIVAPAKLPPVGKVETKQIPPATVGGKPITVRVYTPMAEEPSQGFPVIVYYHGGGWVIASLDTYDASCRGLCSLNKAVVVSVEYRQAPEHKFPAAAEDAYAALQHVMHNAGDFNGDPSRVAVAGESAGGNLATVACLMAEQHGGAMPIHQVLVYPITNYAFDTPSYQQNAKAKPLNEAMMRWFFQQYLPSPTDGQDVRVSPLRAEPDQLRSLPSATIITAEIDPLRSEGIAYAEKLKAAGVDTSHRDYQGVTHEFFGMALVVDEAKGANAFVTERLKKAFDGK